MTDFSQYQHFRELAGADYYLVDDDIILIVPSKGFFDNPRQARESADFQDAYVRKLGKNVAMWLSCPMSSRKMQNRVVFIASRPPMDFTMAWR